jgi:hypothetical protein
VALMVVEVDIVPFGPPEAGHYCFECLLPSVSRQELRAVAGMTVTELPPYDRCTNDDHPDQDL